jgi:SAM-dependent methyltransferase
MRFSWDEQTVQWFLDAGVYTEFHKILAQKIKPYLEPGCTLCDAGCGLGRLDLELAAYVKELTAIDLSANAIDVLRCDAKALGLDNLRTDVCDADTLTKSFDIVVLSFFGQSNMLHFLKLCRHRLIRIVSADNKSGLYPERYRCNVKDTVPIVCAELDAQGIRYKLELYSFEFGQPLRSWRDAELYVLNNAPKATAEEVRNFLNESITRTGRDDFPFYLPNQKDLGIFIIDKEE